MQGWGGSYTGGVGYVMQGWGGSYRGGVGWDGVCHAGVGWVIQGLGMSYSGGVGHTGGRMIHTEHYHHLHTVQCGNYLELLKEPNSFKTTHLITYSY